MSQQSSIGWGIIGPGVIAKQFADALPHSRTGRLVAIASRNPEQAGTGGTVSRCADPCRLRGDARRRGSRGDLHRDPPPGARRMGDPGRGSGQARALRKADRRVGARSRGDDRRRAPLGHLSRRSLHVPSPPDDGEDHRPGAVEGGGRTPHDPRQHRLQTWPSTRATGGLPTTPRAARSSMSAAIRCRWRGFLPAPPRASPSSTRSRSRAWRISARRASTTGRR